MTGDHINKFLFNGTLPVLFEAGRVALPLFLFVLAYNLARPGTLERGVYSRVIKRLALFGVIASLPFITLSSTNAIWPLNILFTLLVVTTTVYCIEVGEPFYLIAAAAVFLVGGALVEYWWPAIAFGVAVWCEIKQPSWITAATVVLACTSLWFINHNLWATAALGIIALAPHANLKVPRLRWVFYAYYPAHLAVLLLIRIPMGKVGYLFF